MVFDFDGVILESTAAKTRAFGELFADLPEHREAILRHHLENLGVSRYEKFAWVYRELLGREITGEESRRLGERFTELSLAAVLASPPVPGASELLAELARRGVPALVVSGTPQEELDLVVERRGLGRWFAEVHGTPPDKATHLGRILAHHRWQPAEVVMIGDGTSDARAAAATGVGFLGRATAEGGDELRRLGVPVVDDLHAAAARLLPPASATAPADDDPPPRSPLTGGSRLTVLRPIPARDLVGWWQEAYGIDIAPELAGHDVVLYCRCEETGLGFFHPPDVAGGPELYAQLQRFDWYYDPAQRIGDRRGAPRWEFTAALDVLAPGERVLEIGCGEGRFLELARDAGIDARGIELSSEAAAAARARGLAVDTLQLDDAARTLGGRFDAVCAFQVLEHVPDPLPFLHSALELLTARGRLILCVPDCDGYLKYCDDALLNMPPHHMLHWTRQAFHSLEGLLPLRVEELTREPLALHNVRGWVGAQKKRAYATLPRPLARGLFNRYTNTVYRAALRAGLRRWCGGHGLFAVLRATGSGPASP